MAGLASVEVDAIEPSVPRRAGVPATHLLGVSAIFVDLFGLAILVPLLPFRHTALVVATTLTAQYGAVLVGQLGWGVASDRLGRRRTLAIVMAGDALLFAATAFARSPAALVAVRAAVGCFAPLGLGIAWVSDCSIGKPPAAYRRNFADVGLSFNVGTLAGALVAGLLGPGRWSAACLISAAPAALISAWACVSTDPAGAADAAGAAGAAVAEDGGAPPLPPSLLALLRALPVATTMGSNFVHGWVHGAFFGLTPIIMADEFGCTSAAIAAVSGAAAVWQIANNCSLIPRLLARTGALRYHAGGLLVCACNTAALAGVARAAVDGGAPRSARRSARAASLVGFVCLYVFSACNLTTLNLMVSKYAARASPRIVGTVTSMGRTFFSVGFCAAPVMSVLMYRAHPALPFGLTTLFHLATLMSALAVLMSGDPDPLPPTTSKSDSRGGCCRGSSDTPG